MGNEELIQELRIDRALRQLQAEGEQVNAAFDARLSASAEVQMFDDEPSPGRRDREQDRENFFKCSGDESVEAITAAPR